MFNLNGITRLREGTTRLFTAENVYGEKGHGGMADMTEEPPSDVAKIGQLWDGPCAAARELGRKWKVRPCITLAGKTVTTVVDTDGPGRFTHIWVTMDARRMRDVILRFYWDGEETPSIEVPVCDFFCCGWSTPLAITALPINVNPKGGMNCYFPMPFRRHARITAENLGGNKLEGFFYAVSMEEGTVAEDEAYFHAQFRRSNPVRCGDDYAILDGVQGRGHYVGTQLAWQQNTSGWWGEGELKAFIDGDGEFPSYCGTGTEDYFGGAWAFEDNYSAPFLGHQDLMTLDGAAHAQNTLGDRHSMYRFHIADPIRFASDLRVTIQTLGWRSENRFLPLQDDLASVAYWYQTEPHAPFPQLPGRDALEII